MHGDHMNASIGSNEKKINFFHALIFLLCIYFLDMIPIKTSLYGSYSVTLP
jgi:hypothetical protein